MKHIDIYIDEDKVHKKLGFLIVGNSPYLQQILCNRKQKCHVTYEIHFKELNNSTIYPILAWVDIFFELEKNYNFSDNIMSFVIKNWNGKIDDKQKVIVEAINEIKERFATKNIVAIMDFDTEYKKGNIENSIIKATKNIEMLSIGFKGNVIVIAFGFATGGLCSWGEYDFEGR